MAKVYQSFFQNKFDKLHHHYFSCTNMLNLKLIVLVYRKFLDLLIFIFHLFWVWLQDQFWLWMRVIALKMFIYSKSIQLQFIYLILVVKALILKYNRILFLLDNFIKIFNILNKNMNWLFSLLLSHINIIFIYMISDQNLPPRYYEVAVNLSVKCSNILSTISYYLYLSVD